MVCSVFVTAQTEKYTELLREVADALTSIGIAVDVLDRALQVDGTRIALAMVDRAHPTPAELAQLVADAPSRRPAVVIADRSSSPGRDVLRRAGWGWLDRRGHLRMWTSGVRIEAPIPGIADSGGGTGANPWTTVGLELALAALIDPTQPVTARRMAPIIGRSVGAVHDIIGRFSSVGLVGNASHLPLLPDLFWETAAHWPDNEWLGLPVSLEVVAERLGAPTLVRVDERAATLGGARIPAAGDLPARAYLPSARTLRRVRGLAERSSETRTWVRVSPVTYLPENTEHPPTDVHPWRVAHPMICALRLAADPARGREVVDDWGIVPQPST
jgi:hypothetical protein